MLKEDEDIVRAWGLFPWWWRFDGPSKLRLPAFDRTYKYKVALLARGADWEYAREQLWAMEVGLAEWTLPAKKGKANDK